MKSRALFWGKILLKRLGIFAFLFGLKFWTFNKGDNISALETSSEVKGYSIHLPFSKLIDYLAK